MQKLIVLVLLVVLNATGVSYARYPLTPMGPIIQKGRYAVPHKGIDGMSMGNLSEAIPADGALTEEISRGSVLNDSLLTGNTDVQLLDLEYSATFMIEITHGDYSISLVPPSGEKLRRETTLQTANYEMDLSSDEGDAFILKRTYSDAETDWVWQIGAWYGTLADGGAAD